jgi:hypothetical protein
MHIRELVFDGRSGQSNGLLEMFYIAGLEKNRYQVTGKVREQGGDFWISFGD